MGEQNIVLVNYKCWVQYQFMHIFCNDPPNVVKDMKWRQNILQFNNKFYHLYVYLYVSHINPKPHDDDPPYLNSQSGLLQ